jgi:hypothetical protein
MTIRESFDDSIGKFLRSGMQILKPGKEPFTDHRKEFTVMKIGAKPAHRREKVGKRSLFYVFQNLFPLKLNVLLTINRRSQSSVETDQFPIRIQLPRESTSPRCQTTTRLHFRESAVGGIADHGDVIKH